MSGSRGSSGEGRIVSLELYNFKSYRGVRSIGPFRSFTAIVGPNGSGKSNVMDAISFVLGIRTDQLRGKLKELLFNDMGHVQRNGYVKLVFEQRDGVRVDFCRVILPTSAHPDAGYVSEYRIDEETVPFDAYLLKLQRYGVLVKARSFLVFQGDIESVAAMHPKELTKMFEHVSGSGTFAKEYTRLMTEKEEAEGVMMQLHGRKKNLLAEARQKKGQIAEAQKHRDAEEELNNERKKLSAWRIYIIEKELTEVEIARRAVEVEIGMETQKRSVSEEMIQEKRKDLSEMTEKLAKGEKQLTVLQKVSDVSDPNWIRISEEKQRLEKRRITAEKKQSDNKKRLHDWTHNIKKLTGDLEELESAHRRFEEITAREEKEGVRLNDQDLEAYNKIHNRILSITGRLQQEKSALDVSQSTSTESLTRLQSRQTNLRSQMESLNQATEVLESKKRVTLQEIQETEEKAQEARHEKRQLVETIRQEAAQRDELLLTGEKLDREISEGKATRRETKRDASIAETIDAMKHEITGVYGRLTSLGKVRQPKYHLAMAVALGADLDSVLVDSRKTAKTCIQYLKNNKRLPLNFLPLDSIHLRPVDENLRRLGGSAKLAIDLLDFDRKYEKGFLFACNNAVVCDDVSEAKHLTYQQKIGAKVVSLDGTMIHKMGYITGGLSENMESRAAKWNDERFAALRRQKHQLEFQLKRLPLARDRQLEDARWTSELHRLQNKSSQLKSEIESYDLQKNEKHNDIEKIKREMEKINPDIVVIENEVSERNDRIQRIKDKIDTIADREFREFSLRLGVLNYREYEEQHLQKAKQTRQQRKDLETQIGHLKTQLDYEMSRELQKPIDDLQKRMESDAVLLATLHDETRSIEERRHQAAIETEQEQEELTKLRRWIAAAEIEMKEFRGADEETRKKLRTLHSNRETLHSKRHLLSEKKNSIIQSLSLEIGEEAVPDLDVLPEEWMTDQTFSSEQAKHEIEKQLQSKITQLKDHLQRSAPNLKAMDQYNQIKDQETEQSERFEQARKNEHEIAQRFHTLHTTRYDAFMDAFHHVSSKIDEIYKDLTKSEMHPYGGTATLYLESEETPFLGGIKFSAIPPAKRYRDMDQLSGGEKTVVALALLFAVHSYRPCPFFILDEIDASLDAVNVGRVVDYIKQRTRQEMDGSFQSIVISLKDAFFHKADCLIGITTDAENRSSEIFTFDLEAFDERQKNDNLNVSKLV